MQLVMDYLLDFDSGRCESLLLFVFGSKPMMLHNYIIHNRRDKDK